MRRKDSKRPFRKIKGELGKDIIKRIEQYHSPEQISGRQRMEGVSSVSHETIYKYIWEDKHTGGKLYLYLRNSLKGKKKRYGKNDSRGVIPGKKRIGLRPAIIEKKSRIGDWEGDTIWDKRKRNAIVTLVDRRSKYLMMDKIDGYSAEDCSKKIIQLFEKNGLPVSTITLDNGFEFNRFKDIEEQLNTDVYFATPFHSWERGLNENTNKLVRQFFTKKQSWDKLDNTEIIKATDFINNRPRKTLGYKTPLEVLSFKLDEKIVALQL
jgi:IS30 family transposase